MSSESWGENSPGRYGTDEESHGSSPPFKYQSTRARKRAKLLRSVTDFEEIEQIGEGAYGQVWMGRDKLSGDVVALKKVRVDQEKEGFSVTAIRELQMLRSLKHENIVELKKKLQERIKTRLRRVHETNMRFIWFSNMLITI